MMRKTGMILLALVVLAAFSAPMVLAKGPKGPTGPAGKSPVGHLYLFQKDPATWEIVEGGAWGKMKYRLWGPEFWYVFNGHRLEPYAEYTLIYYPDPWPGNGLICLGSGIVDEDGNIHIKARVDTCDLPVELDDNYGSGAKIWLVPTSDVNEEEAKMVGWNPDSYLFEYDLITFDDNDCEVLPASPVSGR